MVTRLAKGVLPPNTQIQKDAILAVSKGATVFISYLADAANEHTLKDNRKTISPQNVLQALKDIEFESFLPRVEAELAKFNEIQTCKRNDYRKKMKDKEASKSEAQVSGMEVSRVSTEWDGQEHEERAPKRMRRDSGPMEISEISVDPTEQHDGDASKRMSPDAAQGGEADAQEDDIDLDETGHLDDGGQEEDAAEDDDENEDTVSEQEDEDAASDADPDMVEDIHSDPDSEILRRGQLADGGSSESDSESD